MRWIALPLLIVGGILFFISGCKQQPSQSTGIVIGEYGSMTGPEAVFGQSTHKGIMLALDEINSAGGVLGKQVQIVSEDDQSNQDEAVTAVKKLIDRDNALAILGEVASSRSLAGGGICETEHVPMISPSSTNPDVTKDRQYVFRVCFTDDFQGMVGAQFGIKKGWKKVALLTCSDSDYSKKLAYFFKQTYGPVVAEEAYNSTDTDFTAQLTRIQAANPDAIYLPGYYTSVVLILQQARNNLGMKIPFFGGDGWTGDQVLALGPVSDGCFYTNHYSPDDPSPNVQNFVKAYQAKYGGETPDSMAITGYDAARVLCDSITRAGKIDRDAVRDAIAQTTNFPGAGGSITIDANHNAKKPIVILEIEGGKTHLADTIQPQ